MTREELREKLSKPYARDIWKEIFCEIFHHISFHAHPSEIPSRERIIEHFYQIGDIRLSDGKNIALFEIHVGARVRLLQNRVTLRNLVSRYIDQQTNHGVLVIFHSEQEDYRFTFAAKETEFSDEGELIETETATKRFTYILGPNEACRTASHRLYELGQKKETTTLADVIEAFSVEKLNKEFFTRYKEHYADFTSFLLQSEYRDSVFDVPEPRPENEEIPEEKYLRDFVKKLLGRIVFLHFLQKKGWLGCPKNSDDWKDGDTNYVYHLFEQCNDKEHFHSKFLIPLFHEALNKKNRPNNIFKLTNSRIPYLNGGLFEESEPKARLIDLPSEYFKNLLDFFSQYNFTIDENDPEDHEVGIDPEILGHIFENLLEDNKDKGAYYTPKAIVQYMCRQSLIHYLKTHIGDYKEIDDLVNLKSRGDEYNPRNIIAKNARKIEELLDNIKICDPAIGSGAFPIGLLQEIYWIKLTLDWTLSPAEVKRQIIQNSIYGVDIDAGAVEIARLRFWLALIVDEEEPSPLPNLDYKIMQGNSLLESFEGIPLNRLLDPDVKVIQYLGTDQLSMNLHVTNELHFEVEKERRKSISELTERYFFETNPEKKAELHKKIDGFVLAYIDSNIELHREGVEDQIKIRKAEIKHKQKINNKYKPSKKEQSTLADLESQLELYKKRKQKLHELEFKPERPFFLWHLFFQDILEKGGFDIVIANPPYVRHEAIKDQKPALKNEFGTFFTSTADLFTYFYKISIDILKNNGVLCFISSNKFFKAGYGKNLRRLIQNYTMPYTIIDFGELPVFVAGTDPCILVLRKGESNKAKFTAVKIKDKHEIPRVTISVEKNGFRMSVGDLREDGWNFENPIVNELIGKLRESSLTLKDYTNGKIYYGIKTGLNEAFVIERDVRDKLIQEDPKSEELIKPFLRGKDIKRWKADFNEKYLIKIESSENKNHPWSGKSEKEAEKIFRLTYPPIFEWLSQHRKKLKKRYDQGKYYWELRSCDYWEEFTRDKIIFSDIGKLLKAYFDTSEFFGANTLYILPFNEPYLLAILLSKIIDWYARITFQALGDPWKGGRMRFIYQNIEHVPIPSNIPNEIKNKLSDLAIEAQNSVGKELEDIEEEIDRIVFGLFNITQNEIELIESFYFNSTKTYVLKSDMKTTIIKKIKETNKYFNSEKVDALLNKSGIETTPSTLKTYLSDFTSSGLIFDAGKGWYSSIKEPFTLNTKPIKKIISQLEQQSPFLDFSCWSTEQINPYTQHLLNKFVIFIYTDYDAIEPIAEILRDNGYTVYANPGKSDVERNFRIDKNTVVIRPSITKQPTGKDFAAPIEKILVDLVYEAPKLNIMDVNGSHKVVQNATSAGRVNMASLLAYAERRRVDFSWLKTINDVHKS